MIAIKTNILRFRVLSVIEAVGKACGSSGRDLLRRYNRGCEARQVLLCF